MIEAWGITDKGAVRAENQDCYYLKLHGDDLVAAIVCDGMGGHRAGNVASALAVEVASAYLESLTDTELAEVPGEHLTRALNLANDAVFRKSNQEMDYAGMGTTMVSIIVAGPAVHILNIGDSRAYRISAGGIEKVTQDHSVVEDMVRRGELTPDEARVHPQKNLITRALGGQAKAVADLYEVQWTSGDYFLLCSDGLSNSLTDQEILYEVLHGGTRETCCQRLLDQSLTRGATDNVTAVLIYMG